jgi:thymidylate synthase (FAD)
MKFRVRAPIFVFWDWKRHRIASYNVESARYVDLRPDFYLPEFARQQIGKPGSYTFEEFPEQTEWLQARLKAYSDMGYKLYCEAIDRGIAREQARLFMPMNLYIEFIFSINARSLMNFLSLRNEDNAIYEIQEYADAIEQLWGDVMPDTAAAFVGNNRIAP